MRPKELSMSWKKWFRLLIAGLLLTGLFLFLANDFWQIKSISCQLNAEPCPDLMWAELMNLAGGKNIFLLTSSPLVEKIEKSHPELAQISVKKKLPNKLIFSLQARQAVVAVKGEDGFYLVDEEGVVLNKIEESAGFVLVIPQEDFAPREGEKINNPLLLAAIQVLYESKLRLLEPKSVRLTDEEIIQLDLKNGLMALFSGQKDVRQQLDSLQFIFQQTKIKGEALRLVDLRFDKPVILGANQPPIDQ